MGESDRYSGQLDGANLDARKRDLEERLGRHHGDEKRRKNAVKPGNVGHGAAYSNAFRLSSEFISAILVGAAIGYVIDYFVETAPWGLIVFMLLGFAAGVLSVIRAAERIASPRAPGESAKAGDFSADDGRNR